MKRNCSAIDGEIVYLDVAECLGLHIICAIDAIVFAVESERPGEIERRVVLAEEDDIVEMCNVLAVDKNFVAIFGLGDGLRPAEVVIGFVLRIGERTDDKTCKLFCWRLLLADGVGIVSAIDDIVDDTERGDVDHLVAWFGEIDNWFFEIVFEEDAIGEGAHRVIRRFIENLPNGADVRLSGGEQSGEEKDGEDGA